MHCYCGSVIVAPSNNHIHFTRKYMTYSSSSCLLRLASLVFHQIPLTKRDNPSWLNLKYGRLHYCTNMHRQLFSWKHLCFARLFFLMGRGLWCLEVLWLSEGQWEILKSESSLSIMKPEEVFLYYSTVKLFKEMCFISSLYTYSVTWQTSVYVQIMQNLFDLLDLLRGIL